MASRRSVGLVLLRYVSCFSAEIFNSQVAQAAAAAVPTVDEFAASMHWGTYRATLRRAGEWRRDLNLELINPFTRSIARSWGDMFESDLFGQFEKATLDAISQLLQEVEESAAPGLKDRAKLQAEACSEEAKTALQKTMATVKETMTTQQKETSRLLAPHVKNQLYQSYMDAMEFRGTGSVARQKVRSCVSLQIYKLMFLSAGILPQRSGPEQARHLRRWS